MSSFPKVVALAITLSALCAIPACSLPRTTLTGGDGGGSMDSGLDGSPDTGIDAAVEDTGIDAAIDDTGIDSGTDSGTDAGMSDAWMPSPNGAACTSADTCASGFCVDGVCCGTACDGVCESCTAGVDGTCAPFASGGDPEEECPVDDASTCGSTGVCNGARACVHYGPSTVCAPASCTGSTQTNPRTCDGGGTCTARGTTDCAPFTCDGSVCFGHCVVDADCTSGLYCVGATGNCEPQLANGTACAANGQCASGACVDGVCCESACGGTCEACASALTGAADGVCAPVTAGTDPDSNCATSAAASCGTTGTCDGARACSRWPSGTECGAPSCVGGVGTFADTCDGAGICVDHGMMTCAPFACVGTACRTTCASAADCAAGNYCNTASSTCLPLKALGVACGASLECTSGNCVDGVCCNTACIGTCFACTAARRGSGSNGICGTITAGTDPDNECATQSATTCGTTGSCTGAGACALYSIGTMCGAGSCSSGVETHPTTCDGAGTCIPATTTPCAPYTCGPSACRTSCSLDTECIAGDFCNSMGACVALLSNGSSCSANSQCVGGNCVDGVCCNTSCAGTCLSCSVAGSIGTCSNVPSGQMDPSTCSGASACNGAGSCLAVSGSACASSSSCLSGNCVDGVCCSTSCVGSCRACDVAGSVGTCTPYADGTDPDDECLLLSTCDGTGSCS